MEEKIAKLFVHLLVRETWEVSLHCKRNFKRVKCVFGKQVGSNRNA